MKQVLKTGDRIHFKREKIPEVVKKETYYFSDGSSVYYQIFSDGIVLMGHYSQHGIWSDVDPVLVNEFFGLNGEWELHDKTVVVDGHVAGILKSTWDEFNNASDKSALKAVS